MNRVQDFYSKNREIGRLVIIMFFWLTFMFLTQSEKFYSPMNFMTMAGQFPEYGLMALGGMLCMITGGIDLSVVGVANMASVLCVILIQRVFGSEGIMPLPFSVVLFIAAAAVGAAAGSVNALLISSVHVPPILATLGTNQLLIGFCIVLTGGAAMSDFPKQFCDFFSETIGGFLPWRLMIFVVATVFLWFMLEKTGYGIKIRMYGTSSRAAEFSGISVRGLLFRTYITSGVCAAIGGLMMLTNYSSARADYGSSYTMQTILIIVLGGVSPNGGKGKLSGVVLAILLLKMLESGINRFRSISTYYVTLIWGVVLILALVMDCLNQRNLIKSK